MSEDIAEKWMFAIHKALEEDSKYHDRIPHSVEKSYTLLYMDNLDRTLPDDNILIPLLGDDLGKSLHDLFLTIESGFDIGIDIGKGPFEGLCLDMFTSIRFVNTRETDRYSCSISFGEKLPSLLAEYNVGDEKLPIVRSLVIRLATPATIAGEEEFEAKCKRDYEEIARGIGYMEFMDRLNPEILIEMVKRLRRLVGTDTTDDNGPKKQDEVISFYRLILNSNKLKEIIEHYAE